VTENTKPYESVGSDGGFLITQQYQIKFGINVSYINEVKVDVLTMNF